MTRCFADDASMPTLANEALFVEIFLCLPFFVFHNFLHGFILV